MRVGCGEWKCAPLPALPEEVQHLRPGMEPTAGRGIRDLIKNWLIMNRLAGVGASRAFTLYSLQDDLSESHTSVGLVFYGRFFPVLSVLWNWIRNKQFLLRNTVFYRCTR